MLVTHSWIPRVLRFEPVEKVHKYNMSTPNVLHKYHTAPNRVVSNVTNSER